MKTKTMIVTLFIAISMNFAWTQNVKSMEAKRIKIREKSVEINYYQQGNGDTTLLFLHGWCINSTYWEKQITHFKSNYKVVAIDLPGFGESIAKRENWTIEEYAHDLLSFIEATELKNIVLIGHSMCGDVIMEATIRDDSNIIGLVGIDNFKFVDFTFPEEEMQQFYSYLEQLGKDFKTTALNSADYQLFHPSTPEEIKNRVKNDIANTDPFIGYNSLANFFNYVVAEASKLEELPLKLYLINSDAIPTYMEGLKNHCKNGFEVKGVGATGHYPMNEKPDVFNKQLESILKEM